MHNVYEIFKWSERYHYQTIAKFTLLPVFNIYFYLLIQYFQIVALLAGIASLPSGPL